MACCHKSNFLELHLRASNVDVSTTNTIFSAYSCIALELGNSCTCRSDSWRSQPLIRSYQLTVNWNSCSSSIMLNVAPHQI